MPRIARIKPADTDTYYHITNRIAGMPGDLPFGDVEKQHMIDLIKRLTEFFTVEIISMQVMSNHYHLTCFAPAEVLSNQATAERYNAFYGKRKLPVSPDDQECAQIACRMRDISEFIAQLQAQFTAWFNRTRPSRRRGTLWADRFKSTILERDQALWRCLCYGEMNPVRAGIVSDPADYRFSTWGYWCATGKHPFGSNLKRHLAAYEGNESCPQTLDEIHTRFRVEFARLCAWEQGACTKEIEYAMQQAEKRPSFVLRADRRVRYWTDGLIIGSKKFVQEVAARRWELSRVMQHRMQRAQCEIPTENLPIYSWRCLRTIP